jgi:hypothetical protein
MSRKNTGPRLAAPLPASQPGVRPYQDRFPGRGTDMRWACREAEVVRVDYERMVCDLRYLAGGGSYAREVPLTAGGGWGPRSFMGSMPEEGSIVLVAFAPAHHHHAVQPYIVAYLPNGYKTALNWAPFGGAAARNDPTLADASLTELTTLLEGYYGPKRHKFRKILPGELLAMSASGGEALWDAGVTLRDRLGQIVRLDGYRGEAEVRAGAWGVGTPGVRSTTGLVSRNERLLLPEDLEGPAGTVPQTNPLFQRYLALGWIDADGYPAPDILAAPRPDVLGDGSRRVRVQGGPPRGPSQPEDSALPYLVEHRLELRWDTPNPTLPANPARKVEGSEPEDGPPDQELVLGSVVGADPWSREGRPAYGKLLRPSLFEDPRSVTGSPSMEPLNASSLAWGAESETSAAAFLYRMKRRDPAGGELFLAHDREGHVFLHVPASGGRSGNLGAGRSMEVALQGSLKTTLGANQPLKTSWDLDAAGGARWNWGGGGPATRAMDVTGGGGFQWVSRAPDAEGLGWKVVTEGGGDVQVLGSGALYQEVAGSAFLRSGGATTLTAEQVNLYSGASGTQMTSSGAERHVVALALDHQVGKGRNAQILAPLAGTTVADRLTLTAGSRETNFIAPGTSDNTTWTGSGSATWSAAVNGDWTFQAPAGTFKVAYASSSLTVTPLKTSAASPLVDLGSVGPLQGVVVGSLLSTQLNALLANLTQLNAAVNALAPGSVTTPYVYVPGTTPISSNTVKATL